MRSLDDAILTIRDLGEFIPLVNSLVILSALLGFCTLVSLVVVAYYTNLSRIYPRSSSIDLYKPLLRAPLLLCAGLGCFALSIQDAPFRSQIYLLVNTALYSAITAYLDSFIALLKHARRNGVVGQLANGSLTVLYLLGIALTYYDQRLWSLVILLFGLSVAQTTQSSRNEAEGWLDNCAMCVLVPVIPKTWSDDTRHAIIGSLAIISATRRWYTSGRERSEESLLRLGYPIMSWMLSKGSNSLAIYCAMMLGSRVQSQQSSGKLGWNEVLIALQGFTLFQYIVAMEVDLEGLLNAIDLIRNRVLSVKDLHIDQKLMIAKYVGKDGLQFGVFAFSLASLFNKFDVPMSAFLMMQLVFTNVLVLFIYVGGLVWDAQAMLHATVSYNFILPISFYCSSLLSNHFKRKRDEDLKKADEKKDE